MPHGWPHCYRPALIKKARAAPARPGKENQLNDGATNEYADREEPVCTRCRQYICHCKRESANGKSGPIDESEIPF